MAGIITNPDELVFAVFCVENVAAALGIDGRRVYDALTEKGEANRYLQ